MEDVLTTPKTPKGESEHQNPIKELEILKKIANKHLTLNGASMKTLVKDRGTSRTPEGD